MSIFFKAIIPFVYFLATMMFVVLDGLYLVSGGYKHTSFFQEADQLTSALAHAYAYISAAAFGFVLLVSVVQIALVEFRIDELQRDVEERKVWFRMFLSGFALALPPVALEAINLRLTVQDQTWSGFVNEGSIIYFISAVFLFFAVYIWSQTARMFGLQEV
jgi:hypothetical protein